MKELKKIYFILSLLFILFAVIGYFNDWITDFVAISSIIVGTIMVALVIIEKNKP